MLVLNKSLQVWGAVWAIGKKKPSAKKKLPWREREKYVGQRSEVSKKTFYGRENKYIQWVLEL